MSFTEAQLLTEFQTTNPEAKIVGFVVGTSYTDVYVQNHNDSSRKTGPWVQVANTRTAAQAHTDIQTAMSA